ncbi:ATP-dependent helicase [Enterococcus faecalis]|uniref:UvrD-helicase domain-containing protein n=1 Tax=Enterococcus TaxID=1350 RepID=UPI000CF02F9D|nr:MULTISPECIES: ATP-dependent helicase [Enterococcus]EME8106032.1 ATP-dependent helicase [Enterococcus faecium]EHZ2966201.1 ATP-dependent helicase [Enterococcus faecalis]EJJ1464742.1 ATP-dependent helicase [Enterococcus faecalis]EME5462504.1 ATP-dependent helicase [Enterococcus faecalis]MDT2524769.1 ATP-dependent helicase [Enterococcus raffinosus]
MISESDWVPTDGLELEPEALLAVKETRNTLVEAGPGSGKTELLSQKANYLFTTGICSEPKRILAVSFKKDSAVNLADRVALRVEREDSRRFSSRTFDSFAKNLLDRFLNGLPLEWRPTKSYRIDERYFVSACQFHNIQFRYNTDDRKIFEQDFYTIDFNRMSEQAKLVWDTMLKGDGTKSILTFKMINWLALLLLKRNPKIVASIRKTYKFVFLDEFQDTTTLQYELIKTCFCESNAIITAVGDSQQKIMGWAGAMSSAFETYQNDFSSFSHTLALNRRSNKKIQNLIWQINQLNAESPLAEMPFDSESISEGNIESWFFLSELDEANRIALKVKQLINEGVSAEDICILVKQRPDSYMESLELAFSNNEIRIRNENEYQNLLKENITIIILDVMKAALNFEKALSWQKIFNLKMELSQENISNRIKQQEKMLVEVKRFLNTVANQIESVDSPEDVYHLFQNIVDFFGTNNIQAKFLEYTDISYLTEILEDLTSCLYQYFTQEENWVCAIQTLCGKGIVPLMTIHKSKGLEFNTVFLIDLSDSSFWSYRIDPIETKSTLFVAVSRAKQNFVCTFSSIRLGKNQTCTLVSDFFDAINSHGQKFNFN